MRRIKTIMLDHDDVAGMPEPITIMNLKGDVLEACLTAEIVIFNGKIIKDRYCMLMQTGATDA